MQWLFALLKISEDRLTCHSALAANFRIAHYLIKNLSRNSPVSQRPAKATNDMGKLPSRDVALTDPKRRS